jgi:light-regulated signal transduction histidine kinase (bacteriophytochrome)
LKDILRFSSLQATKEDYKTTDLNIVLEQVLSDIEVKMDSTGAIIKTEVLPSIEAIPYQMGQLFQNLLSNALKFKKEAVDVQIEITGTIITASDLNQYAWIDEKALSRAAYSYNWSREPFARIVVKDNGIGFNESYAEKIFEIFQRLHSANVYEGTGIGLAICKKIVDNHHGSIHAEGKPGEGAMFTIILPVSQKSFVRQ